MSRWIKLGLVTIALAAVLHVAIVELVPVAITGVFMARLGKQYGINRVLANPLPTDKARAVVKPSPDLLYAVCIYDVAAGPVHIALKPPPGYWSLSLFARNTDNFFKLSAADLRDANAEIVLGQPRDAQRAQTDFPAARFVATPGASGVMLARLLVLDPKHMETEVAAQKSVRCDAIGKRS